MDKILANIRKHRETLNKEGDVLDLQVQEYKVQTFLLIKKIKEAEMKERDILQKLKVYTEGTNKTRQETRDMLAHVAEVTRMCEIWNELQCVDHPSFQWITEKGHEETIVMLRTLKISLEVQKDERVEKSQTAKLQCRLVELKKELTRVKQQLKDLL